MVAMMQIPAQPAYSSMSKNDLIEVIETQQKVIADLRWHDEIMSNRNLPIAARFAARAVRKFTQTRQPCDDGYYKGYLPAMEELAGVSASTISRGLELLSSATEALDKHTEELRDDKGHVEKHVLYFRPYDSFDAAAEIIPIKEVPKHGGNRRLPCPDCGCIHRRVKRREECADCGHQFFEQERIIRGDENLLQDATDLQGEEITNDPEPLQLATLSVDTLVLPCNEPSEKLNSPDVGRIQPVEICPPAPVASCNEVPPAELKALPQWVCWRYEEDPGKAKPKKVPYVAELTGRWKQCASCSDPETWRSSDQAQAIYEQSLREGWKYPYDGIGFMFKENGGYVGVDHDNCIDEHGNLSDQAQAYMMDSYGEISPSQTGFKQIVRGSIPRNVKRSDIGVEMYDHSRFFTITGMHLPCTPATIKDQQEQLEDLFAAIAPAAPLPKEARQENTVYTPACPLDDDEVLEKARGASNGAKFQKLWLGDASDYHKADGSPDNSSADLALCRMLAYWTDGDQAAMDRLFRQSGLYRREKWDRKARAGETYGEGTIRIARGETLAS